MGSKVTIKSVKKPSKNLDKKNKDKKTKSDKPEKKKKTKMSDDNLSKIISKVRKNQQEIEESLLELSKHGIQITINMCEDTKTTALKVDTSLEDKKSFRILYEFKKTVKF
jgi:hypothetical protein